MALPDTQPDNVHHNDRYDINQNAPLPVPTTPDEVRGRIFDSSQVYDKHPRFRRVTTSSMLSMEAPKSDPVRPKLLRRRSSHGDVTSVLDTPTLSSATATTPAPRLRRKSSEELRIPPNLGGDKLVANKLLNKDEEKVRRVTTGDLYHSPSSSERRQDLANPKAKLFRRSTDSNLLDGKEAPASNLPQHTQEQSSSGGLGWLFKAITTTTSSWTTSDSSTDPSATADISSQPDPDAADAIPVTVTPDPRRLFGFGPKYQPPAGTMMMPAEGGKAGGGLTERIRREGITSMGRRPVPTNEELNTFAQFST